MPQIDRLVFERLGTQFKDLSELRSGREVELLERRMEMAGQAFFSALGCGAFDNLEIPTGLSQPPIVSRESMDRSGAIVDSNFSAWVSFWWNVVLWLSQALPGSGIALPRRVLARPRPAALQYDFICETIPLWLGLRTTRLAKYQLLREIVVASADACAVLAHLMSNSHGDDYWLAKEIEGQFNIGYDRLRKAASQGKIRIRKRGRKNGYLLLDVKHLWPENFRSAQAPSPRDSR